MDAPRFIRLLLAYEGTAYCGWQLQPNGPTVQALVERAFLDVTGARVRAVAGSRTDSGVHAEGQVVVLPNPSRHGPETLQRALNARLPEDVVVLAADWAPAGFDPRHDAVGKHYRYTIRSGPVRPLFNRRLCWHLHGRLDLTAMQAAVGALLGEHDFGAFRGAGCEARSPVRTIDRIGWRMAGPDAVLDVFGRSFLKQMVRNLVGTFVEIGRARMAPEAMAEILASRDRRRAGRCAPAAGLCLVRIFYDREGYRRALA